ncbi:response regulator [uncultured Winogradskyella sp.]|uniref:response regulator n=1 Tax=uncultured Winogradskyella sp. TaxID=395353 RepID=UPI0026097A01|nr:response regulator [uncultured Winogradskyella sp.]
MKYLSTTLVFFLCFIGMFVNSQNDKLDFPTEKSLDKLGLSTTHLQNKTASQILPKISKDSTKAELSQHVTAMIKWMQEGLYSSNYAPTLIYAEKGIYLARKNGDVKLLGDVLATVGHAFLRINDTTKAKKIFYELLEEGKKANDSSVKLQAMSNLASVYYFIEGGEEQCIKSYRKAISIAEQLKDTTKLFKMHNNLTKLLLELEQLEDIPNEIESTEKYVKQLRYPNDFYASHLTNIGDYHLLLRQPDSAIVYFKKSIDQTKDSKLADLTHWTYTSYRVALEMKEDYKTLYEINNKIEDYLITQNENKTKNTIDAVTSKLKAEQFKNEITTNNLEKELLEQKAQQKNVFIITILLITALLLAMLFTYKISDKKKKILVKDLKVKNKQYLRAKEKSDKLAKTKSEFFATVSHELRTPLYGVIGLSSILLENAELNKKVELKEHEKDLKSLKFSANYLLALINDLLQMNKIDSKSFTKEETIFNLNDLVNTIVFSFEYIRLQHKNTINIIIANDVPKNLKGNTVMLSQILMNLVSNACKFTENGTIDIIVNLAHLQNGSATLNFKIKDEGTGIEQHKLESIFDEFTQIDSSTKTYEGTGLGLPIVKKLLTQAGSSIHVESTIGKGSTFTFALKLKTAPQQSKADVTYSTKDTSQLAGKKILIVEDNRINQIVTKKILKSSDVTCDIAENGEVALHMAKKNNYDLILMDINMPVKDGIEAARDIRNFNNSTPIIALTAVEIEEQKFQIFDSGMNDIIVKPYDIDLFKKTIVENLFIDKRKSLKKLG